MSSKPAARRPHNALSEGVFLSALFVLVVASVPFIFSFASAAKNELEHTHAPAAPQVTVVSTTTTAGTGSKPQPVLANLLALWPVLNLAFSVLLYTLSLLAAPIIFLVHVVLAALAPFILVVQTTLYVFVLVPWNFVAAVARALYPLYMFCAVACLVGVLLGYGGSLVQKLVNSLITTQPTNEPRQRAYAPHSRRVEYTPYDGHKRRLYMTVELRIPTHSFPYPAYE
ncbi:hypothetical protein EXIGLDRAFT_772890 [Exidia glandulosa HHB12029]|uniref:Transmembrane protein n=1 Tax=Exidia glandulosa HHB12029 TaxID=1314781 RepID=A0A165F307_EXIGL|nr:hypothetical protein EXIGLDRAFT_772890 [Exidia glandulosa HHB12029]